nr:3-ketoacyl-CoA thiolase 2, peroxisomal [Tanacetum cinerariifolium]GEY53125.1 3-ketoacyl-CoA thiolase 2, peroxisomal [Tanacetum cinerariifolium]
GSWVSITGMQLDYEKGKRCKVAKESGGGHQERKRLGICIFRPGIGAGLESITANFKAWDRPVNPRKLLHCTSLRCDKAQEQDQAAIVDPKTGDEKHVTISVDEVTRPGTNLADLAKLKPVYKKEPGSTTAGIS